MLEFYTAYKDVNWMMDFCEEMLRSTVQEVVGSTSVPFSEHEFDFGRQFRRLSMKQAIGEFWPDELRELGGESFDVSWLDVSTHLYQLYNFLPAMESRIAQAIQGVNNDTERAAISKRVMAQLKDAVWDDVRAGVVGSVIPGQFSTEPDPALFVAYAFEMVAEEHLVNPTFIFNFPKSISPLSKASPDDPAVAERFELYVAGMEVANGFSELNDPAEQLERFEEQARQREGGDEEAMQTDLDYVRALSYGMPPAAGIGIGIDRMTMLLTNRRSIRDVILFPHMRPRVAQTEDSDEQAGNP
jgi:lysyl-tRNA synthetase class 2